MADKKKYHHAKSKIGAYAYENTKSDFDKLKKRDEADAEVRRETKGASGTESLDKKMGREADAEFRRESRFPFLLGGFEQGANPNYVDHADVYKKGGKVSSASASADGIAMRGKTRGKMV